MSSVPPAPRPEPEPGDWLTAAAVREALAVSDHTLRRLARSGAVRTLRVPRGALTRVYYSRADVEAIAASPGPRGPPPTVYHRVKSGYDTHSRARLSWFALFSTAGAATLGGLSRHGPDATFRRPS